MYGKQDVWTRDEIPALQEHFEEASYWAWDLQGVQTEYAGLPFLIQALEWLGIRETLSNFPELAEWDLPARILRTCIDKLNICHDDPICAFLSEPPPLLDELSINFVAPPVWKRYIFPQVKGKQIIAVRCVRDMPGKRLLTDKSGRFLLACWTNRMPDDVRHFIRDCQLKRFPAAEPMSDMDRIVNAFFLAIIRFLRRYAKMGLRQLVMRPGYVAATRTHLDIMFNYEQIDFQIRQAGLDIDPGWVPWLARVVYFHYRNDEGYEYV